VNRGRLVLGVVVAVIAGTGAVAFASAQEPDESTGTFERCYFEGDQLVLTFTHGSNEKVTTSADLRADSVVVTLRREAGEGVSNMVAYAGEAKYRVGAARTVIYPNGTALDCNQTLPGD
jgi:hypothetical protein